MQRIIGLGRLLAFAERHADCRKWISNWIADVRHGAWSSPQDIKVRYATASFLAENVVIFNVRGNAYRLVVRVAYNSRVIAVLWIGTHADYSKRDCW